jgi:hypothetical protein
MHLDPTHILILVSKIVFVSVCTPPLAIRFSTSAQLASSDLLFCIGSGWAGEVAQEGDRVHIDRTRQAKQAQSADPNTMTISQAAAGTVSSK